MTGPVRAGYVRLSIASRIALASAALGLLVLTFGSLGGYWIIRQQLDQDAVQTLLSKRAQIVHVLDELPSRAALENDRHRIDDVLRGHNMEMVLEEPRTGHVILRSPPGPATQSVEADSTPATSSRWVADAVTVATVGLPGGSIATLTLRANRASDEAIVRGFVRGAGVLAPVLLLLIGGMSWWIARLTLAPLARFTKLASSVTSRNLTSRLELDALPTDLSELGADFNAMLARLDLSVTRLEQFSADLAHEMRTPVAILIGRSQVALRRERSPEELRESLADNVEDLERLARLLDDMLFLATAQKKDLADAKTVELGDIIEAVASYLALVAEERNLALAASGSASAFGDTALIQRAVINLVSNALRHADAKTTVRLAVGQRDEGPYIDVINTGAPIESDQQERIFDRFYRLDAGRSREAGGTGLGLSIVRSIMRAHGGDATTTSYGRQTTFRLQFPWPPDRLEKAQELTLRAS